MVTVYNEVGCGLSSTRNTSATIDTPHCITPSSVLCLDYTGLSKLGHQSNSTGHVEHASLPDFIGGVMRDTSEGRPVGPSRVVIWIALCSPSAHKLCLISSRWSSAPWLWFSWVVELNVFGGFAAASWANIFTRTIRLFVGTLSNNCNKHNETGMKQYLI